jgi:hypothetical protein
VTVTPAITIVLAALLRTSVSLERDWYGLESIAALNELFELVRKERRHEIPPFRIVRLDKPYGVRSDGKCLQIPEMTDYEVLINGSNAPYADVIAPFKLVQAKYCAKSKESAVLYLEEELHKMGLLASSSPEQKQFAKMQYMVWTPTNTNVMNAASSDSDLATLTASTDDDSNLGVHRYLYPASMLVSEQVITKSRNDRTYMKYNSTWYSLNEDRSHCCFCDQRKKVSNSTKSGAGLCRPRNSDEQLRARQ